MDENMDFGGAFDKIREMLGSDEGKQQIRGILEMFGGGEDEDETENTNQPNGGGFDIDPMMILKLGKILSAANSGQSQHSQLLMSLKPFLKEERQSKVDSAVKLMNMTRVLSALKEK